MNLGRTGIGVRTLVTILLAACGGGSSTEPSTGSMTVSISGLPTGVDGSLAVTGPGGYNRSVGHSETLSALPPGSYTVTATAVTAGSAQYMPAPASQPVTVSAGETAAAGVAYAVAEHSLAVTVAGLPAGVDAAITVSGPGGYSRSVTATETLSGLSAGQYTVTALPVSNGSDQYTPSPSTRTVTVNGAAGASVTYSTGGTAGFNLRVDGVYLVQSVQTYDRTVPLVRDRDALLRVFVTANQVNAAMPDVDVTLYADGVAIAEMTIPAPGLGTPLAPDEATLNSSWNVILDKSLIRSNLSITATVDPGNAIAEGDESDNGFPASGTPLALDVRTVDPFRVMFVPVITKVNGRQGNVTAANRADYLEPTTRMHPIESWDATVHAVYTTSTNLALQSDNGNNAWGLVLGEILALRGAESSTRHYYGVVNPNYSSGVAGVGYVGGSAAIGWDKAGSRGEIAAHEWGHNWNRQHAPCGEPGGPDANYPYPNGEIGVIGYDVVNETLKPSDAHDLMGYCSNEWISDYTYLGVMNWRAAHASSALREEAVIQSGMLLWGRIEDGQAVLEPALRVTARPSLPSRPGPYRLEGRAEDGGRLFALDFAPLETAAEPTAAKHFAFVVPMRADAAGRLASLDLAGPGIRVSSAQSLEAPAVTATRGGAGRLSLRWDASKSPMLLVRDPATGEVLSFARGGATEVATDRDEVVVTASGRAARAEMRVRAGSR